ncbi:MAG TPA: CDP-alcohol phosphatidyltransferase family protein [Thermoanaerobacterales bacterium]|nr:CDP-alcohol phosphatidyltransferase family protein [Thermoanaerobacterales bacterium]
MNYVPNLITVLRIICSVRLLFVKPLSVAFFIIYLICGGSDILDGYISRKYKISNSYGATLDSIADIMFFGIMLIVFIPILQLPYWILWWIGILLITRLISIFVGFVKYHELSFLHTYANKATGIALFLFPFVYSVLGLNLAAVIMCGIASLSVIEEFIITLTAKSLNRDVRCIFDK